MLPRGKKSDRTVSRCQIVILRIRACPSFIIVILAVKLSTLKEHTNRIQRLSEPFSSQQWKPWTNSFLHVVKSWAPSVCRHADAQQWGIVLLFVRQWPTTSLPLAPSKHLAEPMKRYFETVIRYKRWPSDRGQSQHAKVWLCLKEISSAHCASLHLPCEQWPHWLLVLLASLLILSTYQVPTVISHQRQNCLDFGVRPRKIILPSYWTHQEVLRYLGFQHEPIAVLLVAFFLLALSYTAALPRSY